MLWCRVLLLFGISCGYLGIYVRGNGLPAAVQLGGAIVAAVEADVEQEEEQQTQQQQLFELELEQRKQWERSVQQFWRFLNSDLNWTQLVRWFGDIEEGRGKHHKRQKLLKYLYPLLMGILIAKTVLVPLILKMLTALSTSSFVMSKIALVTAGFLALKWIFSSGAETAKRLEIVHIPVGKGGGGGGGGWSGDMAWSGSSFVDSRAKPLPHNYIPVSVAAGVAAGGGGGGIRNAAGVDVAIQSGYRFPQHNYDGAYAARPFL